jgi:D-threo-aldose 1-dehydrogenase
MNDRVTARRSLGRSGLGVTTASLGAGGLGNFYRRITNAESRALLEVAWEAGIRYVDTAPFYGRGRSERRLGAFLEEHPRDSFVLSTKVGRILTPARGGAREDGIFLDPAPFDWHYDYSYDGVMRSYEMSLQRLGLSSIDILLVHDIGVALHGDGAGRQLKILKDGGLRALDELRSRGEIRAYGLGVTEIAACLDCLDYADPDVFLLAGRFSLLEQNGAKPFLDRCRARGASVVIGGVFNSGILATGAVPDARYNYAPATEDVKRTVRRLEAVCSRYSVPLSAAALQFPLAHPAVASVLLGAGTIASLKRCIDSLEFQIPLDLWGELAAEHLLDPEWVPALDASARNAR